MRGCPRGSAGGGSVLVPVSTNDCFSARLVFLPDHTIGAEDERKVRKSAEGFQRQRRPIPKRRARHPVFRRVAARLAVQPAVSSNPAISSKI